MINWKLLFYITLVGFIIALILNFLALSNYEKALDVADETTGLLIESMGIIAQLQEEITTLKEVFGDRITFEIVPIPETVH